MYFVVIQADAAEKRKKAEAIEAAKKGSGAKSRMAAFNMMSEGDTGMSVEEQVIMAFNCLPLLELAYIFAVLCRLRWRLNSGGRKKPPRRSWQRNRSKPKLRLRRCADQLSTVPPVELLLRKILLLSDLAPDLAPDLAGGARQGESRRGAGRGGGGGSRGGGSQSDLSRGDSSRREDTD